MKHITDDYKQILINGFTNQLELLDSEDEKDWYDRQVKFFSESLDAYAKQKNLELTEEEVMFLEHAIRAWRNHKAVDTHKDWLELSSSVMQKLNIKK